MQLPIYNLAKRGGNLHQTKIRKIDGDVQVLRDQLEKELGLDRSHVVVNSLTRQIIVKGWKKPEIARFLEGKHF